MNRPLSDDEIVELVKASDRVPEPSPLFWEHAARRVRAAIDAEPPRRSTGFGRPVWTAAGLAAASLAVWLVMAPRPSPAPTRAADGLRAVAADTDAPDEDSWTLVASLGDELDVDAATRVGLVAPGETTDRALEGLDADERAELATLLNRALEEPEI